MPELPEVETARRGIAPHIEGEIITAVVIRDRRLRWPVSLDVDEQLPGATVTTVERRAKYLLLNTSNGTAILHLGMSGHVHIVDSGTPAGVHDHVDIEFACGKALRLTDPRRFGSLHWCEDPHEHALIENLGPEPLGNDFNGQYLWSRSRGRRVAVKQLIMNAHIVVGVGNIYASESLFIAGINPKRKAGNVSLKRYDRIANAIKKILKQSIKQGGTTLRDFVNGNGNPGYFQQQLNVYGRTGQPCKKCKSPIKEIKLGQRSSFYCANCQT